MIEIPEAAEAHCGKRRISQETAQIERLFGFDFQLDGESLSASKIPLNRSRGRASVNCGRPGSRSRMVR